MNRFNDAQAKTLRELVVAWGADRVVLVGASALQCHLDMTWRATTDVDITVGVEFDEFERQRQAMSGWRVEPRLEHRMISPWNIKVDIVPAGPGLRAAGKLVWPNSGHEMQLVGMDLAFEHAVAEPLGIGDAAIRIATLPTIVILKMNSWLDRFADRERDLADIAHVLEEAIGDDDDRRFGDDVIELGIDFELVSAYLVGVDVGQIAKGGHRDMIERFLAKVGDEDDWATARRPGRRAPTAASRGACSRCARGGLRARRAAP